MSPNCSELASISSFPEYIQSILKVLGLPSQEDLSVSAMRPCQLQICSELYGIGNPDISGIGVIVGYALQLILGVVLSAAVVMNGDSEGNAHRQSRAFSRGYALYLDAAILLTFSIQLASIIILVRKDFGISATDFGSLTSEVTWAATLLTMLPMTLICFIRDDAAAAQEEGEISTDDRQDLRLVIVCISWIMFMYTFISRMIASYGPSQIGRPQPGQPQPALSVSGAQKIASLCYQGEQGLSQSEDIAFRAFALGGSLFLSLTILSALAWAVLLRVDTAWSRSIQKSSKRVSTTAAKYLLVFFVALWSIPQLWAIVRFRSMQQALAASIGSTDYDSSWSFGQIVAVTVFLPVVVELVFVYWRARPDATRHLPSIPPKPEK